MIEKTKDFEIRSALKDYSYIKKLEKEDPETLTLEEFSIISTETRIDFAIFNGHFHGFEIKSDKDTLERLPHQVKAYDKVFDYLHIVVGEKYLDKVKDVVPEYWGVMIARKSGGIVSLGEERKSLINRHQDVLVIAGLLWKNELVNLLAQYGVTSGISRKTRTALSEKLCEIMPNKQTLKREVRAQIKSRGDWRVDLRQKQCGAKSRPSSKLSHFLAPLPF
ncbi:MAG: sce7726 family protein [Synergistaceae bacterium]|nr:sce7726 family protein [Synergistaceae bacterium]